MNRAWRASGLRMLGIPARFAVLSWSYNLGRSPEANPRGPLPARPPTAIRPGSVTRAHTRAQLVGRSTCSWLASADPRATIMPVTLVAGSSSTYRYGCSQSLVLAPWTRRVGLGRRTVTAVIADLALGLGRTTVVLIMSAFVVTASMRTTGATDGLQPAGGGGGVAGHKETRSSTSSFASVTESAHVVPFRISYSVSRLIWARRHSSVLLTPLVASRRRIDHVAA